MSSSVTWQPHTDGSRTPSPTQATPGGFGERSQSALHHSTSPRTMYTWVVSRAQGVLGGNKVPDTSPPSRILQRTITLTPGPRPFEHSVKTQVAALRSCDTGRRLGTPTIATRDDERSSTAGCAFAPGRRSGRAGVEDARDRERSRSLPGSRREPGDSGRPVELNASPSDRSPS